MRKITSYFFALSLLCCSYVAASSITSILKIEEARLCLENADENTLVIFDIDRTLVLMGDQLLHSGKSGFKAKIRTYPAYSQLPQNEQDTLLSIVLLKTSHQIIEPESVEIIHQLQSKNIKTIACTTLETGQFGIIPSMEKWRVDSLKHLDLNFENAFPNIPEIRFFPNEPNRFPLFMSGALIASKRTKGEVIKLFLERLGWQPKKIVMIDDQLSALESVVNELNEFQIEFQGFHYRYVEELLDRQILDESLIHLQLSHLLEYHVWLTDEEAQALLLCHKPLQHFCNVVIEAFSLNLSSKR